MLISWPQTYNYVDNYRPEPRFYILQNTAFFKIFIESFKICLEVNAIVLPLQPARLIRPAPAELPQDRNVARVGGCSGAM